MSDNVLVLNYGLFAERLRDLGLTQTALAERVGVTVQHVSSIATGRKPNVSAALAFAIADVLGVEVADLFRLVPAEQAPRPKGAAAALGRDVALVAA